MSNGITKQMKKWKHQNANRFKDGHEFWIKFWKELQIVVDEKSRKGNKETLTGEDEHVNCNDDNHCGCRLKDDDVFELSDKGKSVAKNNYCTCKNPIRYVEGTTTKYYCCEICSKPMDDTIEDSITEEIKQESDLMYHISKCGDISSHLEKALRMINNKIK